MVVPAKNVVSEVVAVTGTSTPLTEIDASGLGDTVVSLEIENQGGNPLTAFSVELRDHPSGEYYTVASGSDFDPSAPVSPVVSVTDSNPASLAAGGKTHVKMHFGVVYSIRLNATSAGGTNVKVLGRASVFGGSDPGAASLPAGSATAARQDTGNTTLAAINTKIPSKGSALAAASTPVTLATDDPVVTVAGTKTDAVASANVTNVTITSILKGIWTFLFSVFSSTLNALAVTQVNKTTSAILTALNDAATLDVSGLSVAGLNLAQSGGAWVGTVAIEATIDGTNWFAVNGIVPGTGSLVTSATADGQWRIRCSGYKQIRARRSVATSGSVTAYLTGAPGTNDVSCTTFDGANVTLGAQADAANTTSGATASLMAFLKGVILVLAGAYDSTLGALAVTQKSITASGTINSASGGGASCAITTKGASAVGIELVSSSFLGTIAFQAMVNSVWYSVRVIDKSTNGYISGFTNGGGNYTHNLSGATQFRVLCTAYTSGSLAVQLNASAASAQPFVVNKAIGNTALNPVSYRTGITSVDKLSAPSTPTASGVSIGGSLAAGTSYHFAVAAGNTYGVTTATVDGGTVAPGGANNGLEVAIAQVTGATYYDLFLSTAAAPLWVGRITEAQRASGGFKIIAVGTVVAGASAAGTIDIGIVGTGVASTAAPFNFNSASTVDSLTAIAVPASATILLFGTMTLTDARSLPTLTFHIFGQDPVSGLWHCANTVFNPAPLSNASSQFKFQGSLGTQGYENIKVAIDVLTGQGASVDYSLAIM